MKDMFLMATVVNELVTKDCGYQWLQWSFTTRNYWIKNGYFRKGELSCKHSYWNWSRN